MIVRLSAIMAISLVLPAFVKTEEGSEKQVLYSFDAREAATEWRVVNDTVMGGVSQSKVGLVRDYLRFAGQVSLKYGGGFASIRSPAGWFDLSTADTIVLRVRGDGKSYKFGVRDDSAFDGVSYRASFGTEPDVWTSVELPINDLEPHWHGRHIPQAGPLQRSKVRALGILISDGQAGPFRLDVAWISALSRKTP